GTPSARSGAIRLPGERRGGIRPGNRARRGRGVERSLGLSARSSADLRDRRRGGGRVATSTQGDDESRDAARRDQRLCAPNRRAFARAGPAGRGPDEGVVRDRAGGRHERGGGKAMTADDVMTLVSVGIWFVASLAIVEMNGLG